MCIRDSCNGSRPEGQTAASLAFTGPRPGDAGARNGVLNCAHSRSGPGNIPLRISTDSTLAAGAAVRVPELPDRPKPDGELQALRALVREDLEAVDAEIRHQLHSDVALVDQVAHYIVNSGGKRLRPLLVLLAARACGYTGHEHVRASAIIEFIHTATLLHDDVVDASVSYT